MSPCSWGQGAAGLSWRLAHRPGRLWCIPSPPSLIQTDLRASLATRQNTAALKLSGVHDTGSATCTWPTAVRS